MRPTLLLSLALAGLVGACAGVPSEGFGPAPLTPTSRFQLQVEPGIERIALAVHDQGMSANQQNALIDLAHRAGAEGAPVIRIEAPSGQDVVANALAWRVKDVLEQMGVPGGRVEVVGYDAPDPRAPVLVGYETLRAHVPRCGTEWTDLTRTSANQGWSNFGCALNANLAAQIANPRDIIQPRAMTPADAGRRGVVYDNYRKGEATAAPQEGLVANQQVSDAVN